MTYDGTDPDSDGIVEADVDNQTTTTEELNNADLANAADGEVPTSDGNGNLAMEAGGGSGLLSGAGYGSGDVLTLAVYGPGDNPNFSTSSSTFQTNGGAFDLLARWDRIAPSGVSLVVNTVADLSSNGDTAYFRFRDVDAGETVGTVISGSGKLESGWTDYSPTVTGSLQYIQPQLRNDDGATTVEARRPVMYIGGKL